MRWNQLIILLFLTFLKAFVDFFFYILQDMNAAMLNPIYAWLMSLTFFSFTGEMNVSH